MDKNTRLIEKLTDTLHRVNALHSEIESSFVDKPIKTKIVYNKKEASVHLVVQEAGTMSPRHVHDQYTYQWIFVLKGELEILKGDYITPVILKEGEMFKIEPGQSHETTCITDCDYLVISIPTILLEVDLEHAEDPIT